MGSSNEDTTGTADQTNITNAAITNLPVEVQGTPEGAVVTDVGQNTAVPVDQDLTNQTAANQTADASSDEPAEGSEEPKEAAAKLKNNQVDTTETVEDSEDETKAETVNANTAMDSTQATSSEK